MYIIPFIIVIAVELTNFLTTGNVYFSNITIKAELFYRFTIMIKSIDSI